MRAILCVLLLAKAGYAAAPPTPMCDDHGDPLPHGAVARLGTVRWQPATRLAWSPDGKWLASGNNTLPTIRLWDATTGQLVRTFRGHTDRVVSLSFSPDGTRLVSTSRDQTVRIWDMNSGEEIHRLRGGFRFERAQAAFGTNGKMVTVVECPASDIIQIDAATGKELRRVELSTGFPLLLSPCGDHVLTRVFRHAGVSLAVCDAATGKVVCELGVGEKPVTETAMSTDGKLFAARANATHIWRVATGKELCQIPLAESGKDGPLQFTLDGKKLLSEADGRLRLWDVESGKRLLEFETTNRGVRCVAFSPDGSRLVTSSGRMRLWDVRTGKLLNPTADAFNGGVLTLAFTPDSKQLLVGGIGDRVYLYDVTTRRLKREYLMADMSPRDVVHSVSFSLDGHFAAASLWNGPPKVWEVATGKMLHKLALPGNGTPQLVTLSADNSLLFGGIGHEVELLRWDLKTGKSLDSLTLPMKGWLTDMHLSRNGKTLVVHGEPAIAFYDLATGKWSKISSSPTERESLASCLSPDEKNVAAVAFGVGTVGIRRVSDGNLLRSWAGPGSNALRYSPDGQYLVAASKTLLRVWEVKTGKALPPIVADVGKINSLAFSPDGKWLATGGGGSTLLWDAQIIRRPREYRISSEEWKWCWNALANEDVFVGGDAQALLHSAGSAGIGRIRERLLPPRKEAERAERLLKLATQDNEAGAKAASELGGLGEGVRPLIERTLKDEFDADAKLRLVVALSKIPKPDPDEDALRAPRLVAVLRQIGTKSAEALLADMGGGKFGDVWQQAARGTRPR